MHWRTTTVLQYMGRRQQSLNVMLRIRQIGQVYQIPVQCNVIGHTLVRFAHILEVLNSLDQSGVFIQYFLDVHRTRRRALAPIHRTSGSTSVPRIRGLLRLLLRVGDRHVCFLFGACAADLTIS